jgi:hypothetical protein
MSTRAEKLLGTDGDVAALRVMMSDRSPAEKQAELTRLAGAYAAAMKAGTWGECYCGVAHDLTKRCP